MNIEVTRCFSSQLMSELIAWRNPQGKEENWLEKQDGQFFSPPASIENYESYLGRLVAAEIGFCLIATSALVETIVFDILMLASALLVPLTDEPLKFFAVRFESSLYTTIWAIYSACTNLFLLDQNLITHEYFSRVATADILRSQRIPVIPNIERDGHVQHVNAWIEAHRPNWVEEERVNIEREGANFLIQEVLAGASAETLEKFQRLDLGTLDLVLIKAVYMYVAGSRSNSELPRFFLEETKSYIDTLRYMGLINRPPLYAIPISDATKTDLENWMSNPYNFYMDHPTTEAERVLVYLKVTALIEFEEQGPLSMGCRDRAIRILAEIPINEGANFICDEVLKGADAETIRAFDEMDPGTEIFSYILTKSIYIYALGNKKNEDIPSFFKRETRQRIEELRQDPNLNFDATPQASSPSSLLKVATRDALIRTMEDLTAFAIPLRNPGAKWILNRLKGVALREFQASGLLATKCWEKAAYRKTKT